MKLGICYMVFDGSELLEFAARSVRSEIDHIAVTYQTTSYFGRKTDDALIPTLERLKSAGLIDQMIFFEPDLTVHHKKNELNLRNIGLQASRDAGCTHHISADVDELYKPEELKFAKREMEEGGHEISTAMQAVYYKDPTWLVTPTQKSFFTFIHTVSNSYDMDSRDRANDGIEITRRLAKTDRCRHFKPEEITIHHMSYVRKDIRRKLDNSDNGRFYTIDKFVKDFEEYKLGDRLRIVPDFQNRRTVQVENTFGITF